MEPICKFESQEQLNEVLSYWQHVLHLDHWCIKAKLVDKINGNDDIEVLGLNETDYVNCHSLISIATRDKEIVAKHCEELTLLHELLHCVFIAVENPEPSVSDAVFMVIEHQKVELLAKSLMMARYHVDIKWFMRE